MTSSKTILLTAGITLTACTPYQPASPLLPETRAQDVFVQASKLMTSANIDACLSAMKTDPQNLGTSQYNYRGLKPTTVGTYSHLSCAYYAPLSSQDLPLSPALIRLSLVGTNIWVVSSYRGTVLSIQNQDGTLDGEAQLKQAKFKGEPSDSLAAPGLDLTPPQRTEIVGILKIVQNSTAINKALGL